MKRGESAFGRAVATVLVLALAAYIAVALGNRLSATERWETVTERSVQRFFSARGIIIRSEIPLDAGSAPEALRLGAGDSMGGGYFAPAAGIYFSSCDGLEYLSPKDIDSLDADGLSRLCALEAERQDRGRLVTGKDWYFAFLTPVGTALEPGMSLRADFGMGELNCLVHSAGEGYAVLRMDTRLELHASLRLTEARIIKESFSGLALPPSALRREDGESFVWVLSAGRLEKKKVNIVFSGEDFLLAEKSPLAGALREGDKVLTAGEELYEGKIII